MRVSLDERLCKSEGRKVEVCDEEKENGVWWYKAIIETAKSKGISHFSVCLVKDNFATPLTQLSGNIRPVPPKHLQAGIVIKEGYVVDAYHKEGWWTGFVIKEMEDNKCLVFFDSPPDIIQFHTKDLRPHIDWVFKKYHLPKHSF